MLKDFIWKRGELVSDARTTLALTQGCMSEKPIVVKGTAYSCAYLGNDMYRVFAGSEDDVNTMSSFLRTCDAYSLRNASTSALWSAAIA